MRKIAAFDPQGFYWRVGCPHEISRKSTVRNVTKKEFKKAFVWALAEAGWGEDGRPLNPEQNKGRLTGAVLLNIAKDPERVLKAKKEDLKRDAGAAVRKILARQDQPVWQDRSRHFDRPKRIQRVRSNARSIGDLQRSVADTTTSLSFAKYQPTG